MKKYKIKLIFLLILTINASVLGQDFKIPKWIEGTWNNSYESDMNNFEYWTFNNDSIFIEKGFPSKISNKTCLNSKYSKYKTHIVSNDSLFRLNFTKDKEIVIYEFKLQNLHYSKKPVLTYKIEINGIVEIQHSTSCNLILTKE